MAPDLREIIVKTSMKMSSKGSRVVEHLSRHLKINGACPATATRSEGDIGKNFNENV